MQIKRIGAFAAVYLLWGGSYLAIRLVVKAIPPMLAASARYTLSGLILLAISICILRKPFARARQIAHCFLAGLLMVVVGYAVVFWSATRLSSWIVAVLVSTSFLWTYIGECFVLRTERMRAAVLVPLLAGLAGIPFLSSAGMRYGRSTSMIAVVSVLAATTAWSAGALALKKIRLPACHLQTAGFQLAFAGIVLAGISCSLGEWRRLDPARWIFDVKPILGMAYLVCGGSVIAFSAFHWLMQRESPHLVATFAYVNPVVAMMLGIGVAHERCSWMQLAVAAIILISVVLVWHFKMPHTDFAIMIEPAEAGSAERLPLAAPEATL